MIRRNQPSKNTKKIWKASSPRDEAQFDEAQFDPNLDLTLPLFSSRI
jgi:hypothetical protein